MSRWRRVAGGRNGCDLALSHGVDGQKMEGVPQFDRAWNVEV